MFELYNLCLQSPFASHILSFISLLEVIFVLVPMLLSVAFITVAERKTMASMQRRLGPNIVGYYGLLQAFADALKLLLKEYISPTQANKFLFFLGPVVTLVFSLLGFSVIPFAPGTMISDFNLGILYMLAMSSLSTYGILLSGWSANSKYAFLGSLRSTAQLISYELILSSAILLVILFSGSLSLTVNIEAQKAIWYAIPLFPVFIIFFIGSVAETNRAPFDLVEAESELVSGYMTEHAAVVFVFFFLAEYASILLICILSSMLFLGGYLPVSNLMDFILSDHTKTVPHIKSIHGGEMENRGPVNINTSVNEMENRGPVNINTSVNEPDTESRIKTFNQYEPDIIDYCEDNLWIENKMPGKDISAHHKIRSDYTRYAPDRIVELISRPREHQNNSCKHEYYREFSKRTLDQAKEIHNVLLERIGKKKPLKKISFMNIHYFFEKSYTSNPILNGVKHSVILGVKSCIMIFIFIWVRASYPRIRYDQLMSFCWTILLPLIIAIIILLPCILYNFAILPNNVFLL